ncbi:MAG: hypothetical protein B6I28_04765 [Fusobacteriia bacterium 4572_132]|nr:MAG: hypothetical protein B6I28_04765 [Fusobacteriia bacterium 4572_132]
MEKIGIIYNKCKKKIKPFLEEIRIFLSKKGIELTENIEYENLKFIIVLGGDGTLIRASKKLIIKEIPVLAVNMGSLGFLTETRKEETFDVIERILEGNYKIQKRNFLEIHFNNKMYYSLNEMVLAKAGILSRMIRIKIKSKEQEINTYRADGIIIATPTGSTAYSMSAGGPIIKATLNVVLITPISPHTLSARPLVVGGDEELTLELIEKHDDAHIIFDGQKSLPIKKGEKVKVSLSAKTLSLIKPEDRDYYSILREKLNWGVNNVKRIKD